MIKRFKFITVILFVIVLCAGCGGSSSDSDSNIKNSVSDSVVTSWHNLFHSSHYSGYLAVMFKDNSDVRLREGKFVTLEREAAEDGRPARHAFGEAVGEGDKADEEEEASFITRRPPVSSPPSRTGSYTRKLAAVDIGEIQTSELTLVNDAIGIRDAIPNRGMDLPEETIERALIKAAREGKRLHDWNLYYTIKVEDPDEAEALYNEFAENPSIKWVHPMPRMYPTGGLGETPDITGNQTYIGTEAETGGLNIQAAWDAGITGQGVRIIDEEYNWNFDHDDLPINEEDEICPGCTAFPFDIDAPKYVQHGTAVIGILAAIDNGFGVTGIANSSQIKVIQADTVYKEGPLVGAKMAIEAYANGNQSFDLSIRPGDIMLIEVGTPGPNTPSDTKCDVDHETGEPTYCLPIESYTVAFVAIEDVTELGIIVVEGANDGGLEFGSPESIPPDTDCGGEPCPNLATDDSGAIMVTASMGGKDNTMPWWSNCGTRINAYAWGLGVTTTGYGKDLNELGELVPNPASDPDDENAWYTNSFNGTSASAALVAGAVALVQSYTKELYANMISIPDYFKDNLSTHVYLDAWQMRDLINQAGIPGDSACNIGKKPDVGAMMDLVESGYVIPHIDTITSTVPYAVAGIRYDMDKDGRAELISWDNGTWKIDLSTVAPNIPDPNPDNYGEWDLMIKMESATTEAGILFPVVHDYDSDGDADLALYDSKNGLWYIKYTTASVIASEGEAIQLDWDIIINYSSDPMWKSHGRPMPGDYDGDNFLDLAVVRPDGHWVIDYGGIGHLENQGSEIVYVGEFGEFEKDVKFLTDAQLDEAPGWAYLPGVSVRFDGKAWIFYRVPDGIADEGSIKGAYYPDFNIDPFDDLPAIYGGNDDVLFGMTYFNEYVNPWIGVKRSNGIFEIGQTGEWDELVEYPYGNYGGVECSVVIADYDGDNADEPAVKCGAEWRISMGGSAENVRIIETEDSLLSLPPFIYPGGMKYQEIVDIYNYYKNQIGCELPNEDCSIFNAPPPIGPHFAECIKYWAPAPPYCWNK